MTRLAAATALILLMGALGCDDGSGGGRAGDEGPRGTGSSATDAPAASGDGNDGGEGEGAETREVAITDERSDRSTTGDAPRFVEIDGARIEGGTDSLSLSMTLAGPVPELMPDEVTTMRVTFTVLTRGGDRYEFFAHATRNGWATFASGRDDADPPFTDDLVIDGPTLVMTLERAYLGPVAPFKWTANVAWTRRAERGEAYAFDFVPKQGYADFP